MSSKKNKPSSLPKTKQTTLAADIKSIVRNTLLASPYFPGLYEKIVGSPLPNSNESSTLASDPKKNIDPTNLNRSPMANFKTCTHIKVTGVRCGSPALRGEQFCYFHQRMTNTVRGPHTRLHHVALLESPEAIQASVMEIMNVLIRDTMELKRAELILRALNTAVRNSRRVQFDRAREMVTKIPNYPAPPKPPDPPEEKPFDLQAYKQAYMDEFHQNAAAKAANMHPAETKTAETKKAETKTVDVKTASVAAPVRDGVGTATPGCPGGPESPGHSDPTTKKTAAVGKAAIDPTQRKPPESIREAAPKERKIVAHPVRGG